MKETGIVYVRMDKDIKDDAEAILDELGISASAAVQMFYKTIIREQGLPLNLSIKRSDNNDIADSEPLDGRIPYTEIVKNMTIEEFCDYLQEMFKKK